MKHSNPTQVAFKTCSLLIKCITKIDAENLDFVMPMCSLIEYSWNYSVSTVRLWFYSKDEATTFGGNIADSNDI